MAKKIAPPRWQRRPVGHGGAHGSSSNASNLAALGGRENVREIEAVASSRLRVRLANAAAVDEGAIRSLGLRGIARPGADRVHVFVGPAANEAVVNMRSLIASLKV